MGEVRIKTADGWSTKPAHKKTSTGWQDIPTHHFINGRWQGELTSQSPLKFRADGEMLDWRVEGKTSENLCERYTSVRTAQQYSASLYMFADIQPSTTYTIAFEIDEGSLQYFNENLFTYSQYYVTGTGNKQMLQLNAKANIQKTGSTWSDTYGWIIAKNYTGNATVPYWKKIQLLEGTYAADTLPSYEPYGGVGDWDETEQKYRIPVKIEGENLVESVTVSDNQALYGVPLFLEAELKPDTEEDFPASYNNVRLYEGTYTSSTIPPYEVSIFTDHQLMNGDSIDFTTDQTTIPLATGNNTLTVDTAVKPSQVFVKFEG